jgi:ABC-type glycerol-3-phosphate transport system substrate-binding protein
MKNIVKIAAVLFFMVLVSGHVFAGGGGQSGDSGEKTLKWLTYRAPTDMNGEYAFVQGLLDKFYQKTGIKVENDGYAYNDYLQILELKFASNSRDYDVYCVNVPEIPSFVDRGYLKSIDKYFTTSEKGEYIPSALNAGSWRGELYAPPENTSSQVLWYNKTLLAEAGITVRASNFNSRLTYEEIVDYAKAAKAKLDPSGSRGIVGIFFEQNNDYQLNGIPNSLGEKNIGDDGFTVDGVLNGPGWIRAATWYQNLFKDGLSLRGQIERGDLWRSGKVVFYVGGTWNVPKQISPTSVTELSFDCGYAPVPAFKGYENKVGTPTGSWHNGINHINNKIDYVIEFIKWWTLGEGNDDWIAGWGQVPSTIHLVDKYTKDSAQFPVMSIAAFEALNTAVPRAMTVGYPEYREITSAAWEDIRNGSDVKTTLDRAVRDINAAFAKYK